MNLPKSIAAIHLITKTKILLKKIVFHAAFNVLTIPIVKVSFRTLYAVISIFVFVNIDTNGLTN